MERGTTRLGVSCSMLFFATSSDKSRGEALRTLSAKVNSANLRVSSVEVIGGCGVYFAWTDYSSEQTISNSVEEGRFGQTVRSLITLLGAKTATFTFGSNVIVWK